MRFAGVYHIFKRIHRGSDIIKVSKGAKMGQKYDKQLKAAVTYEICELGKSTSKTAKEYNIPLKTVENWITAYNKDNQVFKTNNLSDSERIKELENEIKQLKRNAEILKKTLIILGKKE